MNKDQAIKLAKSGFWKDMTHREIAIFQIFEEKLCMPFEVFHEAVEKALGRPVYTHEFGLNAEGIKKELLGESDPPTLKEIIEMIPKEKRVILIVE